MGVIHFIERNVHGAWVIYGIMGIRQYYGYTKAQALEKYRDEYNRTHVENVDK